MRASARQGAPAGRCRPSGVSPQSRSVCSTIPELVGVPLGHEAPRSQFAERGWGIAPNDPTSRRPAANNEAGPPRRDRASEHTSVTGLRP